ncbi:succinylglutamate desuccinylase [Ferrimonas pelagia]|uniref:Succinylglutamate desuccinylase n=1 Tax=Ferrimonas pelagia TaxID=1177826 RepID=A0ABP9EKT4_9GAMM
MFDTDMLQHTLSQGERMAAPLPQRLSHTLADGTHVSMQWPGILWVEPASPAEHDVVLSAGVHGNETAPIELLNELVTALLEGQFSCRQRLLVLFGNPAAMCQGQRELKLNMNRLFCGAHRRYEGEEAMRAALLEQTVEAFFAQPDRRRCHYDLHTAIRDSRREKFAVYPFRHGRPWKRSQLAFLARCGVDTALLSHAPTTTFSYFSSDRFDADAFTVELGKVRPFGQNDLSRLAALRQELVALLSHRQSESSPPAPITVFDVAQTIIKRSEAFRLNFADDTANFTEFKPGALLAQDGELAHRVGEQTEAIVFPNAHVALGQRACLTVVPVGDEQPFE